MSSDLGMQTRTNRDRSWDEGTRKVILKGQLKDKQKRLRNGGTKDKISETFTKVGVVKCLYQ